MLLIVFLSFSFSLLYLGIALLLPIGFIENRILFLIPIYTFLYGVWISLTYYANRIKRYNILGISKMVQSSIIALMSVLLSYFTSNGLVLAIIIGLFFSFLLLFINIKDCFFRFKINLEDINRVFYRYIDFMKYSTFSGIFNSLSNVGLPILISMFFNPVFTGLYFFSNKMSK